VTRALLLALLLAGCETMDGMPEAGAPPRPVPAAMTVNVYPIANATLQGTTTATASQEIGGRLLGRARVSPGGLNCAIEITDAPMTAEQREHIIAHERRHCAGQQHVIQKINGAYVTVWLP
jgi:hypothetical protein